MVKTNVRAEALTLLMRIEKEGGFSHLLLSQTINKAKLDVRDEKLLTEIVYGTIERKMTLDYYLQDYIKEQKKLADWVRMLLRMSVFQFVFLDKVPVFAVINEAVNIAKYKGHKGIASFVNGVLRNIDRKGLPEIEAIEGPVERLAIQTSHPAWLVKRWISYYGFETTTEICVANITRKPICVRVNSVKVSKDTMLAKLEQDGFEVIPSNITKDAIIISKGNILKTSYVIDGLLTIQDQSSMLAARILQVEEGMDVLDVCSAPGGKATYIAELMQNTGTVHAFDLHKNKINVIQNNAKRLGLTNIKASKQDARQLQSIYEEKSFDRILVDAPCSGFGVIRSKPDIKYNKRIEDIQHLHKIQLEILEHVAPLLKQGGKLVYSTCTIEKTENEEVIKAFLDKNNDYQMDETILKEMKEKYSDIQMSPFGMQIFPQTFQSDGFFMTRITRPFS